MALISSKIECVLNYWNESSPSCKIVFLKSFEDYIFIYKRLKKSPCFIQVSNFEYHVLYKSQLFKLFLSERHKYTDNQKEEKALRALKHQIQSLLFYKQAARYRTQECNCVKSWTLTWRAVPSFKRSYTLFNMISIFRSTNLSLA